MWGDGFVAGIVVAGVTALIIGPIACGTYAGRRHDEGYEFGYQTGFTRVCEERGWTARRLDGKLVCAPASAFQALDIVEATP